MKTEIKVLIAVGAVILALLLIGTTFAGAFYLGRVTTGRQAALNRAYGPGMMQGFDRQGQGRGQGMGRSGQRGGGLRDELREAGTVVRGEVKSISGNDLVVTSVDGTDVKVTVASGAEIRERGATATVKDIKVGDGIMAAGALKGDTLTAEVVRIGVQCAPSK